MATSIRDERILFKNISIGNYHIASNTGQYLIAAGYSISSNTSLSRVLNPATATAPQVATVLATLIQDLFGVRTNQN